MLKLQSDAECGLSLITHGITMGPRHKGEGDDDARQGADDDNQQQQLLAIGTPPQRQVQHVAQHHVDEGKPDQAEQDQAGQDGKGGAEDLMGKVLKDPTLLQALSSAPAEGGEEGSDG